jgi:hypothetical protein
MIGSRRSPLAFAILWGLLFVAAGRGQIPSRPANIAPATGINADLPDPLPGLPHPPDLPGSLYVQPTLMPAATPMPGRYFQYDPLLDTTGLPQPGWFGEVEGAIIGAHVDNRLVDTVTVGGRPADLVRLNSAPLDWTIAPRFEFGRRLPEGLGDISLSYRFLVTQGNSTMPGPDGLSALTSRFDLNVIDLDYASREVSLWPFCQMKWRIGLRGAFLYFDSRASEPFATAAAGSGISQSRVTDSYGGVGPHVSLELWQRLGQSSWSVYGRFDGGTLLGQIQQGFYETSTIAVPGGFLSAVTHEHDGQAVPMVIPQFGLHWKPCKLPACEFFMGYQYEHWWNVGRLSTSQFSRGEFSSNGIFVRGAFTF